MTLRFAALLLSFFAFAVSASEMVSPTAAFGLSEADVLETVDVTGDGGIQKLILKRGDGAVPTQGSTVSAHYDGKLASDGKQFDSSYKRGTPFTFPLGQGRVIAGWDKGFATMHVGEQAILVIDAAHGYGARGAGGAIPGGATLYFKVELIGYTGGKAADL